MRYILDDNGYVESVSCNHIECDFKGCTEYKGLIPLGYYSLEEWAIKGNIRAYKIVDGNLTYDPDRAAAIESEMRKGFYPHKYTLNNEIVIGEWCGKPLYRKTLFYASSEGNQKFVPNHNIENFEGIVNAYGRFTRVSTGIQCLIPMNYTSWESWIYDFTGTNYVLRWSDAQWNAGVKDIYVTLEYTKTTDEVREEENFFEEPDLSIDANIPVEPDIPTYTIADNWIPYNNCSIDGTTIKDNLNAWISASNDDNYNALAIDFTLTETHNLKATFEFTGYDGCPRYQNAYIEKDGVILWDAEIDLSFESSRATFTRTINQVLEAGTYKLLIGSYGAMDFGLKCTEFSLSTEIPQNLFDLSSYSFPTTKDGLTFNYDNEEKTLTINGESNNDFGLYIPLTIPPGNYTFSYQTNQTELGFYFSIDEISSSMLTGWGRNNKTFDITSTTSQIILWFDAWYVYRNLELSFNLVKND